MKNKKIWNKCLALALSTAMICSSGSVAFASEFTSGDDIATEQTTPESEDGGVSTDKVVPETEQPEAEFDAPEEAEEFDDGTPEVEAFGVEDGIVAMTGETEEINMENNTSVNVAEINGTNYTSLQRAISSITDSETNNVVKLLANITIVSTGISISGNQKITLDLNGHNIHAKNATRGNIVLSNNAELILKDSSSEQNGKIYSRDAYIGTNNCDKTVIALNDNSKFTMESGNIDTVISEDTAHKGQFGVGAWDNACVTIKGGKIESGWYAIASYGDKSETTIVVNAGKLISTADYAIYNPSGTLNVTGGVIYGQAGGIALKKGTLNVSGGIITSKGQGSTGTWGDGTGNMSNAAINLLSSYGNINATISNGSIIAEGNAVSVSTDKNGSFTCSLKISGGTFSREIDRKYFAEGIGIINKSDDSVTVGPLTEENAVAKINGDAYYDSLNEAINMSVAGDNITLLSNVDLETGHLNIEKNVTLDLNGKTISGTQIGDSSGLIRVEPGVTDFILCDSSETQTGKLVASNHRKYGLLVNGKTIIQSGQIEAEIGVQVQNGGSLETNGGKILTPYANGIGISIVATQPGTVVDVRDIDIKGECGILILNSQKTSVSMENAPTLNVYGGKIDAKDFGISGNGSSDYTKMNIQGGEITSNEVGIYHPQIGDLTVGGDAKITAANGIQYCGAGTVKIFGNAVITATAGAFSGPNKSDEEGDGTVNDGAALSLISRGDGYQDDSHKMNVTIDGGTFVSNNNAAVSVYRFVKVNDNWTVNPASSSNYLQSLMITGGSFKGSATRGSLEIDSAITNEVVVSGGYFAQYPDTKYIASGKVVTTTDEKEGYSYKVEEKSEDSTVNGITTGKTKATVPDGVNLGNNKSAVENAAKSIEAPGIVAATTKELNKGIEKEVSDEFNKIKQEQFSSAQSEVKLYAESFLDVTIKNYYEENNSEIKTLQLDITPKIKYIASTKNDVEAAKNDVNAKEVVTKDLKSTVENLVMSIELPVGFATKNSNDAWNPIYVEHIKNGTVYRYTATVTGNDTKQIATFINPHGFSLFKFTTSAPVASIGEKSYTTIKAAIEDANGSATTSTIKLLGDVTEGNVDPAISISDDKNITLDLDGHTLTGDITNNGSLTITDSKGTGKIDGTVTSKKTTTISSGSIQNVTAKAGTVSMNGGNITGTLATNSGATANVSNGTVENIQSLGTTNIYGGNINGIITKTDGNITGTINAYGGTYTNSNKTSITPASGYYFDGNTIKSIPAPSLSSNSYLSGLTISQGTLTPAFDRNTTAYTAEVENATDSITVTPVKDSNWASLKVNDKTVASGSASEAIKLAEGANKITIRVTAENGSTKDYTITVTRKAAPGEEYTKLQKAVADYETYKKDGYTESSWTAFEKALKEAQEALKDTSLSEEKAKEILANLTKAAGELQQVGTPVIESVKVSGNKATVKLTGEAENAEGYDYVIGKKDCITIGNYADVRKNKGTATKFSYVQKGTYYAYCHAWKKVNGKKVFSAWSAPYKFTVKVTTVSAPKILSVKVNGRTVTVTLKNGKGIAGVDTVLGKTTVKDQYGKYPSEYELVSKNKTTTTIIFKNVPKGTYYVGAHAFKRYGSSKSKVFGKWSNIKKVVVK